MKKLMTLTASLMRVIGGLAAGLMLLLGMRAAAKALRERLARKKMEK